MRPKFVDFDFEHEPLLVMSRRVGGMDEIDGLAD